MIGDLIGRKALAAIAGSFWVQIATAAALSVALVKGYGALKAAQGRSEGRTEVHTQLKKGVAHDNELAAQARLRAARNELDALQEPFRDVPGARYWTPGATPDVASIPPAQPPAAPAAPGKPAGPVPRPKQSGAVPGRVRGEFERPAGDD